MRTGNAADLGLAHADVNDVGVRRCDGHGADRAGFEETVGDVFPIGARVFRFPDAAARRTEVESLAILWDAGDRRGPAAAPGIVARPLSGVLTVLIGPIWRCQSRAVCRLLDALDTRHWHSGV